MTDRELMERAGDFLLSFSVGERLDASKVNDLIYALRERLAQPEQEPMAWELRMGNTDRVLIEITNNPKRARDWKASFNDVVPLYAAPPPWVGLTEEEVKDFQVNKFVGPNLIRAIERRLKEKNA